MYRYKFTLSGCQDHPTTGDNGFGHIQEYNGYILLLNENMKLPETNLQELIMQPDGVFKLKEELEKMDPKNVFSVNNFPNPTNGLVYYEFISQNENQTRIEVCDATSKLVRVFENMGKIGEYKLESLGKGIYYVTYSDGENSITKKLVLH